MAKKIPSKKSDPAVEKKTGETGAESQPAGAAGEKKPAKGGPVKGLAAKSRAKAAIKAPPKKEKKAHPVRPLKGGIPFICSECYEEFVLPATYSRETVTCPECMHVGKRPDENFLRTVTVHKAEESRSLKMAFGFAYMLGVVGITFIWLLSPYSESMIQQEQRGTFTMVVGAASAILLGMALWSASKYEKNRWEIYF